MLPLGSLSSSHLLPYLEILVIQSFMSCYSLLRVIGQEPVHQVEPALRQECLRKFLPEVVVRVVGKGHLQRSEVIVHLGSLVHATLSGRKKLGGQF